MMRVSAVALAPTPAFRSIPRHERPDNHILPAQVSELDDRQRIFAIVETVRQRDILTYEHSRRVAIYAQRLARRLGASRAEAERFALAGQIHDAGKSWIADTILNKTGALTDEEFDTIRAHTLIGERIADAYDLPEFFTQAARHHHENYDGSGYPDGLSGIAIPFVARVLAVADAFDVITSERPYKPAATLDDALAEIARMAGRQFDPALAAVFADLARAHEPFIVPARICAVPWYPQHAGAWYRIATEF
jgi:HD-GYP domain-containing protein (c-di-GMP phosphodiesterase class II)